MRRTIITAATAALLAVFGLTANPASAQLGLTAGLNFAELDDIQAGDTDATFENSTGWHVHIWADVPMGPLALRPGVRFMDMGKLFEDASLENPPSPIDDENARLLEIPIDLRLRLGLPIISPYVLAGPVFRFNTGDDERFKSFSLAGGAGVGVELGLGGLRLYPELKYTFGITRFTEETYELGGVTITPDDDQQLNAVMLSVGIGL